MVSSGASHFKAGKPLLFHFGSFFFSFYAHKRSALPASRPSNLPAWRAKPGPSWREHTANQEDPLVHRFLESCSEMNGSPMTSACRGSREEASGEKQGEILWKSFHFYIEVPLGHIYQSTLTISGVRDWKHGFLNDIFRGRFWHTGSDLQTLFLAPIVALLNSVPCTYERCIISHYKCLTHHFLSHNAERTAGLPWAAGWFCAGWCSFSS